MVDRQSAKYEKYPRGSGTESSIVRDKQTRLASSQFDIHASCEVLSRGEVATVRQVHHHGFLIKD
jgi:hypothetical protein